MPKHRTSPQDPSTPTVPPGTRVRVNLPQSSHHGLEGVVAARAGGTYRVEVLDGGVYLRTGEFEVLAP